MAKRKKGKTLFAKLLTFGLGVFFILSATFLIFSCLFYDSRDSGYNIANSLPINNLLGANGAYAASFVLSWFGLGLAIFLIAPLVWGYEILRYKTFVHAYGRIFAFILGSVCLSSFFDLSIGEIDRFSFGGNIGVFFTRQFLSLASRIYPFAYHGIILGFIMFALALISFNFACGINISSWYKLSKKIVLFIAGILLMLVNGSRNLYSFGSQIKGKKASTKPTKTHKEPKLRESKEDKDAPAPAAIKIAKPVSKIDDGYEFPDINLLSAAKDKATQHMSQKELEKVAAKLEEVLQEFGVSGKIVQIRPGPVVTLYELEPAPGTKTARVIGLSDDIARSMSAVSVGI